VRCTADVLPPHDQLPKHKTFLRRAALPAAEASGRTVDPEAQRGPRAAGAAATSAAEGEQDSLVVGMGQGPAGCTRRDSGGPRRWWAANDVPTTPTTHPQVPGPSWHCQGRRQEEEPCTTHPHTPHDARLAPRERHCSPPSSTCGALKSPKPCSCPSAVSDEVGRHSPAPSAPLPVPIQVPPHSRQHQGDQQRSLPPPPRSGVEQAPLLDLREVPQPWLRQLVRGHLATTPRSMHAMAQV
jgi:hypothetical protein